MTVSVLPETQHPHGIYLDLILDHSVYDFVDSTAKFEICPAESISFHGIRNQTIWMQKFCENSYGFHNPWTGAIKGLIAASGINTSVLHGA